MEEYQSTSSEFYRKGRHFGNLFDPDDVQCAFRKHKLIIENDPAFANMSSGEKTYLKEKRAWLEIFKSFAERCPFPGIEPKHIVDVVPSCAQPSTNEGSGSTGSEDAPKSASSAKGKGKEITPNVEHQPIPQFSNEHATSSSSTSRAETSKVNENIKMEQAQDQETDVSALLQSLPARTSSVDQAPLGLKTSPQFHPYQKPMLLSLDGTPLYSVGPVKHKMAIFWLTAFGSVEAIEECFLGVRVRYNTFSLKLLFYAEPLSVEDKENQKVLKQCAECQKFLESYYRAAEDCSAKNVHRLFANQYLDASVWSSAEGHTRMPQLYYTRRFASPAVVLPKPLAVTPDSKPGSELNTSAVATSTS